jgi:exodeoxyribonuclease VII small subunit
MLKAESETSHLSFEAAMERLDRIVEQMESSKLPLQELILRYEEGIRLIGICNECLAAAENRIEVLNRNAAAKAQSPVVEQSKDLKKTKNDEISLF